MWIIVIGGRASSWMSTMAKRFRWRGLRFLGSTKLVPVVPSTKQLCRALLWKLLYAYMHVWLGTTVFHGTQNFEPSCGICQLPRNFYIFAEFCRIWYWPVIRGQIYGTFWSFSGGHTVCIRDFAMKYMTAYWAVTEGMLKLLIWAYLATNTAYSGSGGRKNLLLYVENLPRWAAEFGKLARGIWKNLPRKTVVPMYDVCTLCPRKSEPL